MKCWASCSKVKNVKTVMSETKATKAARGSSVSEECWYHTYTAGLEHWLFLIGPEGPLLVMRETCGLWGLGMGIFSSLQALFSADATPTPTFVHPS